MAVNWKNISQVVSPVYIAPWGNDILGNGTASNPFKTIDAGLLVDNEIVITGNYYEFSFTRSASLTLVSQDKSFFIGNGSNAIWLNEAAGPFKAINLIISDYLTVSEAQKNIYTNCEIYNSHTKTRVSAYAVSFENCLIVNTNVEIKVDQSAKYTKNTFLNCNIKMFAVNANSYYFTGNLYSNCDIDCSHIGFINYFHFSNYHNCTFKFSGGGLGNDETTFTAPVGATPGDKLTNLKNRMVTVYGGSLSSYFRGSYIGDPLFNDPTNGDYTLQTNSPAKNLDFDGSYVGKYNIAIKWNIDSNEPDGDFLNSEATNLLIADNSIKLDDFDLVGEIEGKPKDCGEECEIAGIPVIGFFGYRNGEAVGKTSDLAASTIEAGTGVLTIATFYKVEDDPITHDGNSFNIGDTFKATNADFTTTGSGVVREITITPFKPNVEWRFSVGNGDSLTNANTLVAESWYVVKSGSATYNSNSYVVGDIFKCSTGGATSFTGSAVLETIFTASDDYFPYEAEAKPTTNRTGNTSAGAITKGNADPTFDWDNEFPVIAKYAQPKVTIQVNNLS